MEGASSRRTCQRDEQPGVQPLLPGSHDLLLQQLHRPLHIDRLDVVRKARDIHASPPYVVIDDARTDVQLLSNVDTANLQGGCQQ